MYSLVLFDLDGTFLDTDLALLETHVFLYQKYNKNKVPNVNEIIYFSGPPIRETIKKEYGDDPNDEIFDDFIRVSFANYEKYLRVYPNGIELLNELKKKNIKVGIVTGKNRKATDFCLKLLNLENSFDVIVASDEVKNSKPSPEGINKAIEIIGASKGKTLYVGDNLNDFKSAKNAGVDSMIVRFGPRRVPDCKPTYFLDDFKDFFEVLGDE